MSVNTVQIHKNQMELLNNSQTLLGKCKISEFKEPLYFSAEEIKPENILELQNKVKAFTSGIEENLIYTISLDDPHSVGGIQSALIKYKKKKIHALSKVNSATREWLEEGSVLYVGSSKGSNFSTRIKNHLGAGSKGVYSLHLLHWIPAALNSGLTIQTYTVDGPKHIYNNINLLELIEQGFWDDLKPMFGKRSGLL